MGREIAFHCLAYGRYYRNSLLDYLLPSLFTLRNASFFEHNQVSLLISTTPSERQVISAHPMVRSLGDQVDIHYHDLDQGILQDRSVYRKTKLMSHAHQFAFDWCADRGTVGSFLSPDMVVSNNFLKAIQDGLHKRAPLTLVPALRMTYLDEFLSYFQKHRQSHPEWSLTRDGYFGSDLVSASMANLHPETASFFFSHDTFLSYQNFLTPTAAIFSHSSRSDSFVGFGMSWFIVKIDFAQIPLAEKGKARRALAEHTIDAYFLNNLVDSNIRDVNIIDDSDECFILSWDRDSRHRKSLMGPSRIEFTDTVKCDLIDLGLASGIYDAFKIQLYQRPWYWHSSPSGPDRDLTSYGIPEEYQHRFFGRTRPHVGVLNYLRFYRSLPRVSPETSKPHLLTQVAQFKDSIQQFLRLGLTRLWRSTREKVSNLNFVQAIQFLVTYKKRIDNPLNQACGGRRLALVRIWVSNHFVGRTWL